MLCNTYKFISAPESVNVEVNFLSLSTTHAQYSFKNMHTIKVCTVYPKKYAHGFCFALLCCGYTLTDCPISIRLTSLALWQSNDCPSASKATLMNMDKYFMWIHYERLHNHNKAKHNKTVCIFLGIYCMYWYTKINQGYHTGTAIIICVSKHVWLSPFYCSNRDCF